MFPALCLIIITLCEPKMSHNYNNTMYHFFLSSRRDELKQLCTGFQLRKVRIIALVLFIFVDFYCFDFHSPVHSSPPCPSPLLSMCSPCSSCTMAVCVAGTRMMLPSSLPHTRRPWEGMYTLAVTWGNKHRRQEQNNQAAMPLSV